MKNFVKTLTGVFLLMPFIVAAGEMGPNAIGGSGWYVAGDIGVSGLGVKESHSSSPESHQLGALGILGGGYIGYEYSFNQFGFAVEGFADATGLNAAITHEPWTYQHNQSYDIGVRFVPEYALTPATATHVILGYTNGRFNIKDNGVYGYINKGYNQSGFQTGLGFTTAYLDNVFFRLDAIYNSYPSLTKTGYGLTASSKQYYTNTFSSLAGELSLIYRM